jgi:putative ubiquitin-RnfH superfamily antitoxin RatB of RatAB toxin-antitoxin module
MAPADRADDTAALLNVEVAYCPRPGETDLVALRLAPGATLADAVQASGIAARHALAAEGLRLGVWGKPREAAGLLRERDRVEIYRPLTVDPKEARRLRYKRHRTSAAATTAAR